MVGVHFWSGTWNQEPSTLGKVDRPLTLALTQLTLSNKALNSTDRCCNSRIIDVPYFATFCRIKL